MSDGLVYQSFEIRAAPYLLQTGRWAFEGYLIEHGNPHTREVKFFLDGTTKSREAAVEIIVAEGKRLVDSRNRQEKAPPA